MQTNRPLGKNCPHPYHEAKNKARIKPIMAHVRYEPAWTRSTPTYMLYKRFWIDHRWTTQIAFSFLDFYISSKKKEKKETEGPFFCTNVCRKYM